MARLTVPRARSSTTTGPEDLTLAPRARIEVLIIVAASLVGIVARRNAVGLLISIELILNAANVNLVAFARFNSGFRLDGQVFALLVVVLAAAEAAVALAIILNFYNNHATVDVDKADELRG